MKNAILVVLFLLSIKVMSQVTPNPLGQFKEDATAYMIKNGYTYSSCEPLADTLTYCMFFKRGEETQGYRVFFNDKNICCAYDHCFVGVQKHYPSIVEYLNSTYKKLPSGEWISEDGEMMVRKLEYKAIG